MIAFGHFLMDDASARRHPLDVAGGNGALISHAIAVLDLSREDIGDGFDPTVRVPGEPGQIILGNVVAEVVEKEEWVEVGRIAEAEGAAQMHAGPSEGGLGFN